jgi:hypothetical protein
VETTISTVAATCEGAIAVICVSEFTVKLLLATRPKKTLEAPVNPDPVIVTTVPPAVVPLEGLTALTAGALPAAKPKRSPETGFDVPLGPTTRTSNAPAVLGGKAAVMLVSEFTANDGEPVFPNNTCVAPVKPLPVIVSDPQGPVSVDTGLMDVMDGAPG